MHRTRAPLGFVGGVTVLDGEQPEGLLHHSVEFAAAGVLRVKNQWRVPVDKNKFKLIAFSYQKLFANLLTVFPAASLPSLAILRARRKWELGVGTEEEEEDVSACSGPAPEPVFGRSVGPTIRPSLTNNLFGK